MATWAVGDVQGCKKPLKQLLNKIGFSWEEDVLWSTGDIINRGPSCLKTLRYFYKHRDRIRMVLGNHDLHLLAVAAGVRAPSRSDTLGPILDAPDRDELLRWLRRQPLAIAERGFVMTHAGIPPQWSTTKALQLAAEVSEALTSTDATPFLKAMYGNEPDLWDSDLEGMERLRVITNYFTRMRYCTAEGRLDLSSKGPPHCPGGNAQDNPALKPWFVHDDGDRQERIIFGHWAALQGQTDSPRHIALDTGCVWGNAMTAFCLETGERVSIPCK